MKKILFMVVLSVSLMVCFTSPTWASGLDELNAGVAELVVQGLYGGGNFDRIIAHFTKAIESGELSRDDLRLAYYDRGSAWQRKGDYDKAIADYTKAIELDPKLAYAYNDRGSAWFGKGDYDKAIADYTKAIELDPKDAKTYNNRGNAWEKKGNHAKAKADYAKAKELGYK